MDLLVLFGVATVLITEGLSVFNAITPINLALAWIPFLALAALKGGTGLQPVRLPRDVFSISMLLAIAGICGVVCFTAVLSPPNSADAMAYHIPRVIYWAQQHSIAFFPTTYFAQIMLQPAAEYLMLNIYELTG